MNKNKIILFLKCFKYGTKKLLPFEIKRMVYDVSGINKNNIESIKRWKNQFQGKRCFIVATGPSLKVEDLDCLKDEITFSMNSIVKIFNDTTWRPTFYVLQDLFAYNALKPLNQYFTDTNIFISSQIAKKERTIKDASIFNLRPYHDAWTILKNKIKFSRNCSKEMIDGRTITYSVIQLAYYMGFKEIFLIGVDWNYEKGKDNHMKGLSLLHDSADFIENSHDIQMEAMHIAYESAEKFACENGFKIYNAGRGGKLDVFERVNLDDLLKKHV